MKRYLIEEEGIPEAAIFAEPHARHTTTNIRNAVRIMLSAGFPEEKPALIASSGFQLNYIERESFSRLCKKMMLSVPFRPGNRINNNELEFYPLPEAFHVNPVDPMDP